VAAHGWLGGPEALLVRMANWTFASFWGVFGWMGLFLDTRSYRLLALASLAALAGFGLYLMRLWAERAAARRDEVTAVAILGLAIGISVAGFLWWNLSFVQHQGRYLFPALAGWAILGLLGLGELARRLAAVLGRPGQARRWQALAWATADAALAALAVVALRGHILPGLH
jgi:hypothetical protein